jgi:hypothetical protein
MAGVGSVMNWRRSRKEAIVIRRQEHPGIFWKQLRQTTETVSHKFSRSGYFRISHGPNTILGRQHYVSRTVQGSTACFAQRSGSESMKWRHDIPPGSHHVSSPKLIDFAQIWCPIDDLHKGHWIKCPPVGGRWLNCSVNNAVCNNR